mmetsp:Transcript_45083/g.51159  ORF Transcript_45083/g.51159 Transcript_45083/m.51159 type:complete len:224 (+) Transcript_45083:242-913(+)
MILSMISRSRRLTMMKCFSYSYAYYNCYCLVVLFLLATTTTIIMAAEGEEEEEESYRIRRADSKPWLLREFQLFNIPNTIYEKLQEYDYTSIPQQLFISPFTIILVIFIVVNVYSFVSYHLSGSWVEASHILVKDASPKTVKGLVSLKEQISTNYKLFGVSAQQYSQCPSSEQKGDLGRFGKGQMVPAFDQVCFHPNIKVGTTIGPIETQHGYHLIYIRKRKL